MLRLKRLLLILAIAVALYLLAFTLLAKAPQGTKEMIVPNATAPVRHGPYFCIYLSVNNDVNRIGRIVFYPLIAPGEAFGWWLFMDDTRGLAGSPCLLLILIYQVWDLIT